LFERIQRSTSDPGQFEGFIDRLGVFLDLPEQDVRDILDGVLDSDESWRPNGLPGIFLKPITAGTRHSASDCALVHMEPGTVFPRHGHRGDEWGFVLQGEALEDNGRKAKPGDIVFQTRAGTHSFAATGEQVFMFFSISDGLEFSTDTGEGDGSHNPEMH
jgi:quercetin dioxygenase-like cupin family protein